MGAAACSGGFGGDNTGGVDVATIASSFDIAVDASAGASAAEDSATVVFIDGSLVWLLVT